MSQSGESLLLSARRTVPLFLLLTFLCLFALRYASEMADAEVSVLTQEQMRLRERLNTEQTRLDSQVGASENMLIRRVVGGLGLYSGLERAYLADREGVVKASLSRRDLGRSLDDVLTGSGPQDVALREWLTRSVGPTMEVERFPDTALVLGQAPVNAGERLLVLVDVSRPLLTRRAALRQELLREALWLLLAVGLLAWALHRVWFRRAERLAQALSDMGAGRLDVRTGVSGSDELALIGRQADRMAERLQAEQARLTRMTDVIDRSPVVVIEWRNAAGWPVPYVSESLRQWGYAPDDFTSGRIAYNDLFHPDDAERVNAEIAHYFRHGPDEYRQEYRLRCADGRWAWVDDRTRLERNAQGKVIRISGILLDITAQRQAQRKQLEQSEMLRLFYDLPFIGMAISSPVDKRWLQVNDRLCDILGYPREELLRLPWTDITHPDDLARNVVLFNDLTAGRVPAYTLQKRFIRKDGAAVHTEINVRPLRHDDGSVRHLFTTVQDITERLRAEARLLSNQERLERAEAMAQLGSWSFDPDSGQLWWSGQMYRSFGLAPGSAAPSAAAFLARVHPDDKARVEADMRAMTRGESLADIEFRSHPDLGAVRWFRGTVRRQERDVAQAPIYNGTLLDITPVKLAEERLQRANEVLEQRVAERTNQLSEANNELEAFSYTVSHDLRAPLRGIDGYSQLLLEEYGPKLDEEGQHFVQRIRSGIALMGDLISDLLDYSHLDRRTMEHDPVEVSGVVDRVLEMYDADIERGGVQVVCTVEPLTLRLDREGLNLALRNLVGNALKFSQGQPDPRVEIGARREGDRCLIWVKDRGVGFDMQYHDRIFGIFQRLHRSEDYAGTGVGLALVSKAVQRMGGRVWAQSAPGQGATFFLEFPV